MQKNQIEVELLHSCELLFQGKLLPNKNSLELFIYFRLTHHLMVFDLSPGGTTNFYSLRPTPASTALCYLQTMLSDQFSLSQQLDGERPITPLAWYWECSAQFHTHIEDKWF